MVDNLAFLMINHEHSARKLFPPEDLLLLSIMSLVATLPQLIALMMADLHSTIVTGL